MRFLPNNHSQSRTESTEEKEREQEIPLSLPTRIGVSAPCAAFSRLFDTAILGFSIINLASRHCPAPDRSPRPNIGSVRTALCRTVAMREARSRT